MKAILSGLLCVLLAYGIIWFYKESMAQLIYDVESIRQGALSEVVITIGREEPCLVEINLASWKAMNELSIYRWVSECEDELKTKEINQ